LKKTAAALAITSALLFSLMIEADVVRVAKANPYSGADDTIWRINSPQNHTAYNHDTLTFSFECETTDLWNEYDDGLDLEYCIDGLDYWEEYEEGRYMHVMPEEERVPIKAVLVSNSSESRKTFQYSTQLPSLTDGQHKLSIYKYYKPWGPDKPFINTEYIGIFFHVDSSAPKITNLSVDGSESGDRLLSFSVEAETTWVGYSLDGKANATIDGDVVLKGLSAGSHYVTVYAESKDGNLGASETLFFTVDEAEIEPFASSSPTPDYESQQTQLVEAILAVSLIVIVVGSGVGLLVYLVKRK